MSSPRKTFPVAELLAQTNHFLRASVCSAETRLGAIRTLEIVLHATGNYQGYGYLVAKDVPAGCLPGINHNEKDRFFCTDDSRRCYAPSLDLSDDYADAVDKQCY